MDLVWPGNRPAKDARTATATAPETGHSPPRAPGGGKQWTSAISGTTVRELDSAYWLYMTKRSAPRRHLSTSPFPVPVAPPARNFAPGERVTHDRYGLGKVIGVEDDTALLVDFGSYRVRILDPYTGLHKL